MGVTFMRNHAYEGDPHVRDNHVSQRWVWLEEVGALTTRLLVTTTGLNFFKRWTTYTSVLQLVHV